MKPFEVKFLLSLLGLASTLSVSASAVIPQHIRLARRLNRKSLAVTPRDDVQSAGFGTNATYQMSDGAIILADGSPCGDPQGTADPSKNGGPNGLESWLDCGVDGDGWVPPPVTLSNIIYKDFGTMLKKKGNPFSACKPYLSMFEDMANETGLPTILLASIALQESGCDPTQTGGAGEIGMMQVTSEKCPAEGDCYDPETNIGIGARYLKSVLDQTNGNLAEAMGWYNGWYRGLTVDKANDYPICAQHNNLDYLQNVFNGFMQGVDPYTLKMGTYHNTCP